MDISNEASVDPFSIGPSTIVGRTIAFRILFCKSVSHLRHQILHVLVKLIYRFRDFVAPMVASQTPTGDIGNGDSNCLFVETIHKCKTEGRNGLPEEILEKYDENCIDL